MGLAQFVDRQVDWIHRQLLGAPTRRALELGCGPGFYLERLARLGQECRGIDLSPVSMAHAGYNADRFRLPIEYVRHLGQREANWFSAASRVFSAQPHLCLHECHWHEPAKATTERYWVVDNRSREITEFASTLQA